MTIYANDLTLELREGVPVETVHDFADALYQHAKNAKADDFMIFDQLTCPKILLLGSVAFEDGAFEKVMARYASTLWNDELRVTGDGESVFYKAEDGRFMKCGTIQWPDGSWKEVEVEAEVATAETQ